MKTTHAAKVTLRRSTACVAVVNGHERTETLAEGEAFGNVNGHEKGVMVYEMGDGTVTLHLVTSEGVYVWRGVARDALVMAE